MDIHKGMGLHRGCKSLPKYVYNTSLGRYERKRSTTNRRVTKSLHTTIYSWGLQDNFVRHLECSHTTVDLCVFALDTGFHDGCVTKDDEG